MNNYPAIQLYYITLFLTSLGGGAVRFPLNLSFALGVSEHKYTFHFFFHNKPLVQKGKRREEHQISFQLRL